MNILTAILNKEFINTNSSLKILSTPTDNDYFLEYIKELGHEIISENSLYMGDQSPNLVLCNNKVMYLNECKVAAIRYHIPLIIVDHNIKNPVINDDVLASMDNFECVYKIAINNDIAKSWGTRYDKILPYKDDAYTKQQWNDLFYNNAKRVFSI